MIKHATERTKVYIAWQNMKYRCDNKNHPSYKGYGGRGISYCEEWKDFSKFLSDMGEPREHETLERIDNSKGYSKDNCKWATKADQCRNTRTVKLSYEIADKIKELTEKGLSNSKVAKELKVNVSAVKRVLYCNAWSRQG